MPGKWLWFETEKTGNGAVVPAGAQGSTGAIGAKGLVGPQGPIGLTGPAASSTTQPMCVEIAKEFRMYWGTCVSVGITGTTYLIFKP